MKNKLLDFFFKFTVNFKFESKSDLFIYLVRFISFDRKLIAPAMYLNQNIFTLKLHMLFVFFFPVLLVMIIFFDSFMTIDYIFFFFTDEADFDDFIALIYMVLFFFLILSDYDSSENNNVDNVFDYTETALKNNVLFGDIIPSYAYYNMDSNLVQPRNLTSVSLNYYDKNFFSNILNITVSSMHSLNAFVLIHLSAESDVNSRLISKIPTNNYILDDNYALNTENKFNFLSNVVADDIIYQDSSDIYIYSFYLILFDLELARLFLFINNVLLRWLTNCLNYFNYLNKYSLTLISNNLEISAQLISMVAKKSSNKISHARTNKMHLINFITEATSDNDIDEIVANNHISWFLYRNTYNN